ncbi:MAG: hypothetical protein Q8Q09_04790 [Deltaproteobacteria bacterium]|nr:hypothetical protein [Deltaproteobacteria bacterium]
MTDSEASRSPDTLRRALTYVTGAAMVAVGVLHFVSPAPFERIVPPYLPGAYWLVLLSGAAEIALGSALFVTSTRWLGAWGLVALYVAVFPANLHMAMNHVSLTADAPPPPTWALLVRLPMQLVLIANAVWIARGASRPQWLKGQKSG